MEFFDDRFVPNQSSLCG